MDRDDAHSVYCSAGDLGGDAADRDIIVDQWPDEQLAPLYSSGSVLLASRFRYIIVL